MANSPISEAVDQLVADLIKPTFSSEDEFMGFASGHGVCVYMPEFNKVAVIGLIRIEDA